MNKKIISKLLHSDSEDDVLLGINFMKDYKFKDLTSIKGIKGSSKQLVFDLKSTVTNYHDARLYKSSDWYMHWNSHLFIYKQVPGFDDRSDALKYEQL